MTVATPTFLLGLDGVPVGLLRELVADGTMPRLGEIVAAGRLGAMASTIPEISSVAWTSTMTGTGPGSHGIYGFTDLEPGGYRLRFPSLRDVRTSWLWESWNARGARTAIVNVPSTYPAPSRVDGVLISGFVAVDLARAVTPAELLPELERGDYRVDVRSELAHRDLDAFVADLNDTLDRRQEAWRRIWRRERWDLFVYVITGTDRLMHFLYAAADDPTHPYHDAFRAYFRRVDACVGEAWDAHRARGGGAFFMMSDHGFGPLRREIMTNGVLGELGFFSADPGPGPGLEGLHPTARAFALDPARVYVHDSERWPRGPVPPSERRLVAEEIAAALRELVVDGERPAGRVVLGHETFDGPEADRGPDVIVIGADGWDWKARLDPGPVVRPTVFTGKHTYPDAFVLAAGDVDPAIELPRDVTGVRRALETAAFAPAPVGWVN